jgi:hypothetical protein
MVAFAKTLKSNSLAMAEILTTDEKVIDDAHKFMTANQVQLTKHTDSVIKLKHRVGRNTLGMWCAFFFVVTTTLLMYFFIRLFPKR